MSESLTKFYLVKNYYDKYAIKINITHNGATIFVDPNYLSRGLGDDVYYCSVPMWLNTEEDAIKLLEDYKNSGKKTITVIKELT